MQIYLSNTIISFDNIEATFAPIVGDTVMKEIKDKVFNKKHHFSSIRVNGKGTIQTKTYVAYLWSKSQSREIKPSVNENVCSSFTEIN